ncbi:MAG: decarboxylating NADP(+)-dependent phosphogluconate dehydrogenase [Bacteroidales bacterium]|nr:decarboxylating NADP(+)-dependent phosphogluconate dehydrogenase [Bacteroidales bacterium]
MKRLADIGLIGLAVMGENLVLNMESKGFTVAVYNRTAKKTEDFVNGRAKGKNILPAYSLEELVASTSRPHRIMIMVRAGRPVDEVIENLLPYMYKGDTLIDGGNSNYRDTIRRTEYIEGKGMLFVGTGISGGEEGALTGPSLMPGGSPEAWPHIRSLFRSIAARVDDGTPCCDWIGENGAGHFVKMVHNGIEYGDMQLISEVYYILKRLAGLDHDEMYHVFDTWNRGELNSYLIEITRDIMKFRDADGQPLLEKILDAAGQKGTGKWTSVESLDLGVPLTLITEAVFARFLSARKEERMKASELLKNPAINDLPERKRLIEDLRMALYAAKIVSYAQGYSLMRAAAEHHRWDLDFGGIALIWRGGCIIRSAFLDKIQEAYQKNKHLPNLLIDDYFSRQIMQAEQSWRRIVSAAVMNGLSIPALVSGLTYLDGYRSDRLPANLIQAQRDYFGAHTYERTDRPRGEFFHTNWTGRGGETTSGSYEG